jgi:hypothetical protein
MAAETVNDSAPAGTATANARLQTAATIGTRLMAGVISATSQRDNSETGRDRRGPRPVASSDAVAVGRSRHWVADVVLASGTCQGSQITLLPMFHAAFQVGAFQLVLLPGRPLTPAGWSSLKVNRPT